MHTVVRNKLNVFLIVLCVVLVSASSMAVEYVTRDEIARALSEKIDLGVGFIDAGHAKKQAFLKKLDITGWAAEVLPENMEVRDEHVKEMVLDSVNFVAEYDNLEYTELGIKMKLLQMALYCNDSMIYPRRTEEEKKAIATSVTNLLEGVRASMLQHLSEYVPVEKIDSHLDVLKTSYIMRMDRPWVTALRKPIGQEEIDRLIYVFDERLARTKDRVAERIDIARGFAHNEDEKEKLVSKTVMGLLFEITDPVRKMISRKSTVEMQTIDPDSVFPAYSQITRKYYALQSTLYAEWLEKTEEERAFRHRWADDVEELLRPRQDFEDSLAEEHEAPTCANTLKHNGIQEPQATENAKQNIAVEQPASSSITMLVIIAGLVAASLLLFLCMRRYAQHH
jgi:hypothetical protein